MRARADVIEEIKKEENGVICSGAVVEVLILREGVERLNGGDEFRTIGQYLEQVRKRRAVVRLVSPASANDVEDRGTAALRTLQTATGRNKRMHLGREAVDTRPNEMTYLFIRDG